MAERIVTKMFSTYVNAWMGASGDFYFLTLFYIMCLYFYNEHVFNRIKTTFLKNKSGVPGVAQWVKDLALP